MCKIDFSISHGGRDDCKRHVETKKHKYNGIANANQSSLSKFVQSKIDHSELDIIRSESLFTGFLLEHNLPIATADHAGPLLNFFFPDSQIAKKYGSGRTKSTAILNEMSCQGRYC